MHLITHLRKRERQRRRRRKRRASWRASRRVWWGRRRRRWKRRWWAGKIRRRRCMRRRRRRRMRTAKRREKWRQRRRGKLGVGLGRRVLSCEEVVFGFGLNCIDFDFTFRSRDWVVMDAFVGMFNKILVDRSGEVFLVSFLCFVFLFYTKGTYISKLHSRKNLESNKIWWDRCDFNLQNLRKSNLNIFSLV